MTDIELRWGDCDALPDHAARIDCRLSHLNDGFHAVLSEMQSLSGKLDAEVLALRAQDNLSTSERRELRHKISADGWVTRAVTVAGAFGSVVLGHWLSTGRLLP